MRSLLSSTQWYLIGRRISMVDGFPYFSDEEKTLVKDRIHHCYYELNTFCWLKPQVWTNNKKKYQCRWYTNCIVSYSQYFSHMFNRLSKNILAWQFIRINRFWDVCRFLQSTQYPCDDGSDRNSIPSVFTFSGCETVATSNLFNVQSVANQNNMNLMNLLIIVAERLRCWWCEICFFHLFCVCKLIFIICWWVCGWFLHIQRQYCKWQWS